MVVYTNTSIYQHSPQNLWLSFSLKFVGLAGSAAVAAVMGAHMIRAYGAPSPHATAALKVAYFSKGVGRIGQNQHWLMEASQDTRAWRRTSRYCRRMKYNRVRVRGCGVVNQLRESWY